MQIQDHLWRGRSYRLRISSLFVICLLLAVFAVIAWPSALKSRDENTGFAFKPASAVIPAPSVGAPGTTSISAIGADSGKLKTGLGQLGAATQPDATPSSSNGGIYFPETGHSINLFKDFWQRSGGLETFGYPLTDEMVETDPGSGASTVIQYFSTQVLEYHPEHKGTPYEVQLQRLGVDDAVRRGLMSSAPFQPTAQSTERDDCSYFTVTQHQVCGEFLDFWRSHGLEFGDAGISERESVALFGYPISEPFRNSDTGAVTQYFERARMELQPGASGLTPVVLSWLGADLLYARQPAS